MTCEGAGKRRIFAIGNYVVQRLLRPYHLWMSSLLKTIPMDGTFEQTRPLSRLTGFSHASCFDFSSATDRYPCEMLELLLKDTLGELRAGAILNALHATPFRVGRPENSFPFCELLPTANQECKDPRISLHTHFF